MNTPRSDIIGDNASFRHAVDMNDAAHRRTLVQEAEAGRLTEQRFREISEEAKLWLRHLDFIYRRT